MEEKQVGIIGAGISGLLACKYALSKGFEPIVFESGSSIGGVWTKTIESTKLQTPKLLYQFSDFPWPSSVAEEFPNQHQTLDYIQSYARHFDLLRHITFNSKVVAADFQDPNNEEMQSWSLSTTSKGTWNLLVEDTHNHSTKEYQVKFLIVCAGRFSGAPNIPEFPEGKGPEVLDGEVIHSKDYTAMDYKKAAEFVKGKRVTVVGFQKFALDISRECSIVNGEENPCTLLYRTEHWNIPDFLPWGVPLAYLYLNRFSELLVHKPGESFAQSLLATILSPLRWGVSKFVESYIKSKLKLEKYGMVPQHSFHQNISSCVLSTVPADFYDRVDKGSIVLKKSQNFSFCKQGIVVDNQSEALETDLVIFATGFNSYDNIKHIFVSPAFRDYINGPKDAKIPLYRECIHPRIPQLAILGFSESISNLYTSEMRCKWLAELLDGSFKLPSIKEMEKDVAEWDKYMKRYSGRYYKRSCIGALHVWYNDQLCKDMGWNPKRKKGLLAELFEPYGPLDYVSP